MSNNPPQPHLSAWLHDRDTPCPVCNYNLRSLPTATCPECNAPLKLTVFSPNLHMGPWFFAVVSLALGVGFDGVVVVIVLIARLVNPPQAPAERLLLLVLNLAFFTAAAVCGSGLAWVYLRRKKWAFASRPRQWWIAWAIFAITLIAHALFGLALTARF